MQQQQHLHKDNHSTMSSVTSCSSSQQPILPSMIVFDLDDCLWTPEMHELYSKPTRKVYGVLNPWEQDQSRHIQGVVGLSNNLGETVTLYDGARRALFELVTNPKYQQVKLAVASTSLEPSFSHACLEGIDVTTTKTIRDIIHYHQIGRNGKLSSRKTTHFRELHRESGIAYDEMLFFDDCNWGDHCEDVSTEYGVVSMRTPNGLQYSEFIAALDKYRNLELESREIVSKMVR